MLTTQGAKYLNALCAKAIADNKADTTDPKSVYSALYGYRVDDAYAFGRTLGFTDDQTHSIIIDLSEGDPLDENTLILIAGNDRRAQILPGGAFWYIEQVLKIA